MKTIKEKLKRNIKFLENHFDINESIDFSKITGIKAKLEKYFISIQNDFESFFNENEETIKNISKIVKEI